MIILNSGSGMLCKLGRKHNQRAQRVRQGCAVWVDVPCFYILCFPRQHDNSLLLFL